MTTETQDEGFRIAKELQQQIIDAYGADPLLVATGYLSTLEIQCKLRGLNINHMLVLLNLMTAWLILSAEQRADEASYMRFVQGINQTLTTMFGPISAIYNTSRDELEKTEKDMKLAMTPAAGSA